jgi:23S rRNA pseudouridine1911/1915/1917 synthase
MVVAKNDHAHNHLARQFLYHTITRKYRALAVGVLHESRGTISSLIGRSSRDRKKMSSRPVRGRQAVTHWEVLKRYRYCTLLEVTLETGRTHQIRVHLASIHHPVLGDPDYGGRTSPGFIPEAVFRRYLSIMKRQGLHAFTLGFVHPALNAYVEFSAPPPEDFQSVLSGLEEID